LKYSSVFVKVIKTFECTFGRHYNQNNVANLLHERTVEPQKQPLHGIIGENELE
jgi:hypothetical protein